MNLMVIVGVVCGGAILTAATLPGWRRYFLRRGWVDAPGGRKSHRLPIALAGGVSVLGGLLLILAGCWFFRESWGIRVQVGESRFVLMLAGGAAAMTLLGWWDDRIELRPGVKFGGQAFIVAVFLAALDTSGEEFTSSGLRLALSALFLLAATNAFNFLDNMNGLCAGLGIIASLQIGVLAIKHQPLLGLFALALAGALLGFIPFNFPRASVFLGDAGSHLTGFCVSGLALALRLPPEGSPLSPWLIPLVVTALPLADLAWVVLLRWRLGRPFYVGDNNHLSHQLVRAGLTPAHAVLVLWAVAVVLGVSTWWLA